MSRFLSLSVIGPLLLALGAGCGDNEEPETYQSPTPPPNIGEETDISGIFAFKTVLTQCVEKSVGDGYDFQTVVSYHITTIEQGESGTEGTFSSQLCWSDLSEVSGSNVLLDEGFAESAAQNLYPFSLSAPEIGAKLTTDTFVEVRGANLDDPDDVLPTDVGDSRIYDFDGDGNPGFTLQIRGLLDADLYAVERYTFALDGVVYSADEISGYLEGYLEDAFMESTKPNVVSTDFIIYPVVDPLYNFFEMKRIESDYTCERLTSNYQSLFPDTEETEARAADPCASE